MTVEEMQEQILSMQEQLKEIDELRESNKSLKDMNDKLFAKNQEMFLRVTGKVEEEDEKNIFAEYVGEEFYNTLSNKEKQLLEIILKGEDE